MPSVIHRILLTFTVTCVAVACIAALSRVADKQRAIGATVASELSLMSSGAEETLQSAAKLRSEVFEKRRLLRQYGRDPEISAELLLFIEGGKFEGSPRARAELRAQLGLGWDASPDFVMVSKRVLKQLDYTAILSASQPTDVASKLLALGAGEQSALRAALKGARERWKEPPVERAEPGGDIVAHYSIRAPDPAIEQVISNQFASDIEAALGGERADLLLPRAWRELRSQLGPKSEETVVVRRSVLDGEPDLVYEYTQDGRVTTNPVRYAHYPSSWFMKQFPGGWQTLADREGFELPARFRQ